MSILTAFTSIYSFINGLPTAPTVSNPSVVAPESHGPRVSFTSPSSSSHKSLLSKFWSLFSSVPERDEKLLPATYRFPTLTFLPENRVSELQQILTGLKDRVFDLSVLLTKLCEANPTKSDLLNKINHNFNKLNSIPPAGQAYGCKKTLEYIAAECIYLSFANMDMLLPWLTKYGTFRNVSFKHAFLDEVHRYTDIQEFATANIDNTDEFFRRSSNRRSPKKTGSDENPSSTTNTASSLNPVDPKTILPSQVEHIHSNNISVTGSSDSAVLILGYDFIRIHSSLLPLNNISTSTTDSPPPNYDSLIEEALSSYQDAPLELPPPRPEIN
ncbi:unnamed protein product [Ambrosiozyma monospora]|uniref:Unnamed protein product n=1 Tax=Ambrosiozyma monospora TaxID=43982 RepID=A0ACB5TW55_AMBMO|nr:unnamed protein product [Ambrosiozyma monospora]